MKIKLKNFRFGQDLVGNQPTPIGFRVHLWKRGIFQTVCDCCVLILLFWTDDSIVLESNFGSIPCRIFTPVLHPACIHRSMTGNNRQRRLSKNKPHRDRRSIENGTIAGTKTPNFTNLISGHEAIGAAAALAVVGKN